MTTVSEALSYSSAYAFHNLGGIDRSVRVFALPPIHVREMRLNTDIDNDYRDGLLRLHLLFDSGSLPDEDLSCVVQLHDPAGKAVEFPLAPATIKTSVALRPLISKSTFPTPFTGAPRSRASTR